MPEPARNSPPANGSSPQPWLIPPRPINRGRILRGLIAWLAVAAAFGLLLKYDVALMRWRFAVIGDKPSGTFKVVLFGLRNFAQLVPIVTALIIVAAYDRRRWSIIAIFLSAQILASFAYNPGKYWIARYRPRPAIERVAPLSDLSSRQSWIGLRCANDDFATQSFPSGHSAGAFAFAGVFGWFYPPLRRLFWVLASGCAASRFLDAVHWPSDCLAGAAIGYAAAWLALHPSAWTLVFKLLKRKTRDDYGIISP